MCNQPVPPFTPNPIAHAYEQRRWAFTAANLKKPFELSPFPSSPLSTISQRGCSHLHDIFSHPCLPVDSQQLCPCLRHHLPFPRPQQSLLGNSACIHTFLHTEGDSKILLGTLPLQDFLSLICLVPRHV